MGYDGSLDGRGWNFVRIASTNGEIKFWNAAFLSSLFFWLSLSSSLPSYPSLLYILISYRPSIYFSIFDRSLQLILYLLVVYSWKTIIILPHLLLLDFAPLAVGFMVVNISRDSAQSVMGPKTKVGKDAVLMKGWALYWPDWSVFLPPCNRSVVYIENTHRRLQSAWQCQHYESRWEVPAS
jgi:hypothetical protein